MIWAFEQKLIGSHEIETNLVCGVNVVFTFRKVRPETCAP